jgi:DNA-binding beta-propeller fold protein YncE
MKKISTASILAVGMLAATFMPSSQAAIGIGGPVIPIGVHPNGMEASPNGETLYIAGTNVANVSSFWAANTAIGSTTAKINPLINLNSLAVETGAKQLAINPAGTLVFILNTNPTTNGTVDIIDQATNTELITLQFPVIGPKPLGIRVSPNGEELWVANSATPPAFNNGTVSVISLKSKNFGTPINLINTGGSPNGIVFNATGTKAFVLNSTPTGWIDQINTSTFNITHQFIGFPFLNSPNPLAFDLISGSSSVVGNSTNGDVLNVLLPSGSIPNIIFMFPGVLPPFQAIGQVLVSPDKKWIVTADIDIGALSIANAHTFLFSEIFPFVGAHVYYMAFHKSTLYVSLYNSSGIGTPGGTNVIVPVTGF